MTSVATDVASLALDAGQTGTKVRVVRTDAISVELTFPGVRTDEPLMPQLAAVAVAARAAMGGPFDTIAVGTSGLTDAETGAADLLHRTEAVGARRVLLAHDSVTSYLGSVGDARGAVVAAGTGVVTLAVGSARVARVDGWGNIMGDAGSAYWIGREALDAAMRAHDGRSAHTALLDVVRDRWPDIENAYIALQSDPDRVRIVASFAEAVTSLAATDPVAAQVALRAARELSLSVSAALGRVREPDDSPADFAVGMLGGVFRSHLVRARFEDLMRESWPGLAMHGQDGIGLDGVVALLDLPPAHPLHRQIAVSER